MARNHPLPTTDLSTGRSPLLNFRLGRGDAEMLDRFVKERGMSRSDVCREALRRYLTEELRHLEEAPKAS